VQTLGDAQSALVVQVVRQAVGPQAYGLHVVLLPAAWQVPAPLQTRAAVAIPLAQAAPTQTVPLAYRRQAPAPLQLPSFMHVAAPASVHWFSGSWPAGTAVQVPAVPDSAHDWQVPVQAVAQQTPCWQKALAHSVAPAQAVPFAFLVQTPPMQTLGLTQSPSTVQVVRQTPVPQT
jgi:hypothetical protein